MKKKLYKRKQCWWFGQNVVVVVVMATLLLLRSNARPDIWRRWRERGQRKTDFNERAYSLVAVNKCRKEYRKKWEPVLLWFCPFSVFLHFLIEFNSFHVSNDFNIRCAEQNILFHLKFILLFDVTFYGFIRTISMMELMIVLPFIRFLMK